MQRKDRVDASGALLLTGFSLLLGFNQVLVKLVNTGLDPLAQVGLRSLGALCLVAAFALITRKQLSITDGSLGLGLLNGLFFSLEFALLFAALDFSSVARVSLFFYTMPLWVALGAHFLVEGEQLTGRRSAGLGIALVGVGLGLFQNNGNTDGLWIGDLLSLLAAGFWAAIALLLRTTRLARVSPEMNLIYQLSVSGLLLTACAWLFFEPIREPTALTWGILSFQIIFVVSIGFLMWTWLVGIYPVSDMASFSLLTPIFAVGFGWLIFDDRITPLFLLALTLVLLGLVLVNQRPPVSD